VVSGLARCATGQEATSPVVLVRDCSVLSLLETDTHVAVHTSRGVVLARTVVLATNGWTTPLVPSLAPLLTGTECFDMSRNPL